MPGEESIPDFDSKWDHAQSEDLRNSSYETLLQVVELFLKFALLSVQLSADRSPEAAGVFTWLRCPFSWVVSGLYAAGLRVDFRPHPGCKLLHFPQSPTISSKLRSHSSGS